MRMSEAIKAYGRHLGLERSDATAKGYMGDLLQFCVYMRNPLITQMFTEQIEEYFQALIDLGWKKNSLTKKSMAFRKFFEYYKRKGYPVLDWESLPIMRKQPVVPTVATRAALSELLAQAAGKEIYDIRNRAIILLFADGGMRNSELCDLNLDEVDTDTFTFTEVCIECKAIEVTFTSRLSTMEEDTQKCNDCGATVTGNPNKEGTLFQFSTVLKTKKRKTGVVHRQIFWYQEANEALKKWIKKRNEFIKFFPPKDPEALFIGVKTWRAGYRMRPGTVGLMLRELSLKAGIEPPVKAHSIRHMFGFEAAESSLNNSNISDLMGHASLQSSFVYTHLRGKSLGKAHAKVKRPR